MKNKIGWCNTTWNPIWGCLNNCEYCYARKIAKRFWKQMYKIELNHFYRLHPGWAWTGNYLFQLKDFKPTFLKAQFDKTFPKKPQKIFVGSMSEIYDWEEGLMNAVLDKIKKYPQHIFQFLTRYPEIYLKYKFPKNCWLGITITEDSDINESDLDYYYLDRYLNLECIVFLSLEPLHSSIPNNFIECFDWVIIGAETGSRKGKVIPKKEWIENIVDYCRDNNIPVYLKDSLKEIYPVEIKEFPDYK